MYKKLFLSIFLFVLFTVPLATHAYDSKWCAGGAVSPTATCAEQDVGPFLKGITQTCANQGNCQFKDIMQVFTNIGTFILGIVGGVVLLMYVIGGFYYLGSHGDSNMTKKGKSYITGSTVGLLIIMFAALLLNTLNSVLTGK